MNLDRRLQQLYAQRDYLHMQVAQQYTPYGNAALPMAEATADALLQAYWMAATPEAHVARLLAVWELPLDAQVLDCGCGTGSVVRFAQQIRPDIQWTLLGHDAPQLAQCPPAAGRVRGDMHALPLQDGLYDGVLLAYVLGYGFAPAILEEIARVLKPGGTMLWYDLATQGIPADSLLVALGYQAYPEWRVRQLARGVGMHCVRREPVPLAYAQPSWRASTALRVTFEQETLPVCSVWRKDA